MNAPLAYDLYGFDAFGRPAAFLERLTPCSWETALNAAATWAATVVSVEIWADGRRIGQLTGDILVET